MNAISGLLSGLTYYYGKLKGVNNINVNIFTCTPSRLGYAKGIVYDEGYH